VSGAAARTVVVGLGATGLSCLRYLHAQGVALAATDSRAAPPGLAQVRAELPRVPLALGGLDAELLRGAERIVLSPGVDPAAAPVAAAARAGVPILGDIELFCRAARAPVVAATGSNGKRTVLSWLAAMATALGVRAAAGANLGLPALELLPAPGAPSAELYLLELSSFQLETTHTLRARAAVVLNVSADHLDRHGSMEHYAELKSRVYQGDGTMVINRDDARVAAMARAGRDCIGFTLEPPAAGDFGLRRRQGEAWLVEADTDLLPLAELRLPGLHHAANALATLALAAALGWPRAALLEPLRRFPGLPHRCRHVAHRHGLDWYDDSKATNAGAASAAIHGLAGHGALTLLAGGEAKQEDFSELAEAARGRVQTAILLGRDAGRIAAALRGVTRVQCVRDMDAAVRLALRCTPPGGRVLLAPACASFDMYRDYCQRGEDFARAVRALATTTVEARE